MKNLIKGDIRRILCKKSLWATFIVAIMANLAMVMFYMYSMKYSSFNFAIANLSGISDFGGMIIGVAVFIAVYADDFKSMTIISIIGRGNSRLKIIIAKFINSVIITFLLFIIFALQVFVLTKIMGIVMIPDELLAVYMGVIKGIYITIGYVTMASIFMYATGNIAFSVFMVVMLYLIIPVVLQLSSMLPLLQNMHLSRYEYSGLASEGLTNILLGMPVSGIAIMIGSFIIYVGGSLAIIYAVFNKKELDF